MKIFIYESDTSLQQIFHLPARAVPLLNTTVSGFFKQSASRQARLHNVKVDVYTPQHWEDDNGYASNFLDFRSDTPEVFIVVPDNTVLAGDILKEDLVRLEQSPGKLFHNKGIIAGYLSSKDDDYPEPINDETLFNGALFISADNYLKIQQVLVQRVSTPDLPGTDDTVTLYGAPVILADPSSIQNSTICAPTLIGKDVRVVNSYIAPGSVITGDSNIISSRVYSSVVIDSTITNSNITNTVIPGKCSLSSIKLGFGSALTSGTNLFGVQHEI